MYTDFVLNGEGHGEVASMLGSTRFEPGLSRPFIDDRGARCVILNTGKTKVDEATKKTVPIYKKVRTDQLSALNMQSPVINETSLRKDEWKRIDSKVQQVARKRLRAWADLSAASPVKFDGMTESLVEHETMSDPGFASVDMDGLSESQNDSPKYELEGTPLPITHSSFWISERRLAISRKRGTPLDMTMTSAAARRVAETIEQTTIGTMTGLTYGVASQYGRTPSVYGYTNFPARATKTDMTAPTGSNGPAVLTSWLALRDLLYQANHFENFMVYTSSDWDQYLDTDFSSSKGDLSLRSRLKMIDGVRDIKRLDYLTDTFTVLFVEMSSDVADAINGMDMTTVQWQSQPGKVNFKVMAIHVPRLKADFDDNCGIAHGTTA